MNERAKPLTFLLVAAARSLPRALVRAAAGAPPLAGRRDRRPLHAHRPERPHRSATAISPAATGSSISATPIAPTSARPTSRRSARRCAAVREERPGARRARPADLHHRRSGARHAGGAEALSRRLPPAPDRPHRQPGRRSPRSRRISSSTTARAPVQPGGGYAMDHSRQIAADGPDRASRSRCSPTTRGRGDGRRARRGGSDDASDRFWEKPLAALDRGRMGGACATAAANAACTSSRMRIPASVYPTNVACKLLDRG